MRKYIFIILSLLAMTAAAQVQQRGIVKEYKGKDAKTSLGGVEVAVSRAGKTISAADGSFTLTFNSQKSGQKVNVIRIEKEGYEIFNKEAVEQWVINPNEPFTIVMCKSEDFRRLRDSYSAASSASYAKQKAKDEARLAEMLRQGELKQKEYEEAMKKMVAEYETKLANIEEYADRFARMDLSEVSATERDIAALVEQGNLDAAIAKYEEQDLLGKYRKATESYKTLLKAEEKLNSTRDSLLKAINRQYEVYYLAAGDSNITKIKKLYKGVADTDTTDVDKLIGYGNYCLSQLYFREAREYFSIAIRNTKEKRLLRKAYSRRSEAAFSSEEYYEYLEKALQCAKEIYKEDIIDDCTPINRVCQNLMIHNFEKREKAEEYLKQINTLAETLKQFDFSEVDIETLIWIETANWQFYKEYNEWDKADDHWKRALEYIDMAKATKPETYYLFGGNLYNFGFVLWEHDRDNEAEEMFVKAAEAAASGPNTDKKCELLRGIGGYLNMADKFEKAKEYLLQAIDSRRTLFNSNPRRHRRQLGCVLEQTANAFYEHGLKQEAYPMSREAAELYLAQSTYSGLEMLYNFEDAAHPLIDLDDDDTKEFLSRAEKFLTETRKKKGIEETFNLKFVLYKRNGDSYHDAESWERAIEIYRYALDMAKDIEISLYDRAYLTDKIGWCLYEQEKVEESKPYYMEATQMRGTLAIQDSEKYSKDYTATTNVLTQICAALKDKESTQLLFSEIDRMEKAGLHDNATFILQCMQDNIPKINKDKTFKKYKAQLGL